MNTSDEGWAIHTDASLRYRGRVVVPQSTYLREEIIREFHYSCFVVHLGGMKMYHYLTCQQVKVEHQRVAGLLQPLEFVEWKWEHITMDFVTHFPWTSRGHDAVWLIVDRLTKSTHFLAMRITITLEEFGRLYIREIVRLHVVPVSLVSDRDPRFTIHF